MSVLASPIMITSTPSWRTPSANAAARPGEEARMSWPITIARPAHQPGEGGADVAHEVRVELVAHDPADVVGLEDAGQVTHRCSP